MTKVYFLAYDTEHGNNEEWNMFYTPFEVFDTAEARQARIEFLKNSTNYDDEPSGYEFHTMDFDVMTIADANAEHRDQE